MLKCSKTLVLNTFIEMVSLFISSDLNKQAEKQGVPFFFFFAWFWFGLGARARLLSVQRDRRYGVKTCGMVLNGDFAEVAASFNIL